MVAKAAPPPSMAEASANSCEMLTNEPTTNSGDGMAKACPSKKTKRDRCEHRGERSKGGISNAPHATKGIHLQISSRRRGQQPREESAARQIAREVLQFALRPIPTKSPPPLDR